jgi:hypothetical protein
MNVPEKIRVLVAHCKPPVTPGTRRRIGAVASRRSLVPESALLASTPSVIRPIPKLSEVTPHPLPTTEDDSDRKLIGSVRFAP